MQLTVLLLIQGAEIVHGVTMAGAEEALPCQFFLIPNNLCLLASSRDGKKGVWFSFVYT